MKYVERAKNLLERLGEYRSDFPDLLEQLEDLRQRCMAGMVSEKVHVKSETGTVEVREVFPGVAQQCIMTKLAVLKELARIAALEETETQINLTFNLEPLEADLEP
jgi:hypothetical protein